MAPEPPEAAEAAELEAEGPGLGRERLRGAVAGLLAAAAREVLPAASPLLLRSGGGDGAAPLAEQLRPAQRPHGPDFELPALRGEFRRLRAAAADGRAEGVEIATVSPLGLARRRVYGSPRELAEALVACLPQPAGGRLLARAAVDATGTLLLTTRLQLEAERAAGRLMCEHCGRFQKGPRGLRWHAQVAHGRVYEAAAGEAEAAQLALGSLLRPGTGEAATSSAATSVEASAGLRAAKAGDLEALRALAARPGGWDWQRDRDRHGSSALHWAAGEGHVEVCEWLRTEQGLCPDEARGRFKRTPLHWAARNGRLGACAWLAAQGVAVDARAVDGSTPFHYAVWMGHRRVADWLLERGGDLHARNRYGCNASQWAAQAGDVGMLRWLRKRGLDLAVLNLNRHSAVHKAALKGQAQVCRWLLAPEAAGGAGLGLRHLQPDPDGNTPAELARLEGFAELATFLLAEERRRAAEGEGASADGVTAATAAEALRLPAGPCGCRLGAEAAKVRGISEGV